MRLLVIISLLEVTIANNIDAPTNDIQTQFMG